MKRRNIFAVASALLVAATLFQSLPASAQLLVTVSPVKLVGNKAVVKLAMKNSFSEGIKSARAVCFLVDPQGGMIGQSAKWVIGQDKVSLQPGASNSFNFVVTSSQPFASTNLTANLSFSRVVLDNGRLANVQRQVAVTKAAK